MDKPLDLEHLRHAFHLEPGALVMDVGAFRGDWTGVILPRNPGVLFALFEPVPAFHEATWKRFSNHANVVVFKYGLSSHGHKEAFFVRGDSSGPHRGDGGPHPQEELPLVGFSQALSDIAEYFGSARPKGVALLKINIEGEEYNLLDGMLSGGHLLKVDTLLVQFHGYGAQGREVERRDAIRRALALTHNELWCEPFCWEAWRRR